MAKKKIDQPTRPTAEDINEWEDLAPEEFKFERPGDFIQGVLLDAKETSLGGMSYTVQSGKKLFYFFGGKQIDPLLPDKVGYEIRVEYKGLSKVPTQPGYNPMKQFSVKYRRAPITQITDEDVPF